MEKYIFWKQEGIVSKIIRRSDTFIEYEYALGDIKEGNNSFMGSGKIRADRLVDKLDFGTVILF